MSMWSGCTGRWNRFSAASQRESKLDQLGACSENYKSSFKKKVWNISDSVFRCCAPIDPVNIKVNVYQKLDITVKGHEKHDIVLINRELQL